MAVSSSIADALAQAARDINSPGDLDSTLDAIVHTAVASLRGIDHVGISIAHRDGRIQTKAGTDSTVWELDQLQYDLGEGPCLHSIDVEAVTTANNLRHDQRWPRYVAHAVQRGVKAQMGLRLYVEAETLGGLNLYSTQVETIAPDVEHTAELFATHAAVALGRARRESQLSEGMANRKTIGQAIGLVMERYKIDEDRAFQFLVRASQTGNVKLRDIAHEVVDTADKTYRDDQPNY